jgi:cell division septum initiation protein DivIVA
MAKGRSVADVTTLQMALVGYQYEKQKIEDRIREIEAQLKGKHSASTSAAGAKKASVVKRVLSPAARKRIGAAQKKRWAEHRKRMAAQAKGE